MGEEALCTCMDDPRDGIQREFTYGEGEYSYKKIVSYMNNNC